MTLLAGDEKVETNLSTATTNKKMYANQVEATWAGSATEATAEQIAFRLPEPSTAAVLCLGVFANATGEKPGTLLGQVEQFTGLTEGTPRWVERSITLSRKLKKGEKVWLAWLTSGGNLKFDFGGSAELQKTSTTATFSTLTETEAWSEFVKKSLVSFYVSGTEEKGLIKTTLTASLSSSGTLPRSTGKQHAAALSFAGVMPRNMTHSLRATLTSAGVVERLTARRFVASMAQTGQLGRLTAKPLNATLTSSATLGRKITYAFKATLETFVGFASATRGFFQKSFDARLTTAAALSRNVTHRLAASLPFAGQVGRTIATTMRAAISSGASLPRNVTYQLHAALPTTVGLSRMVYFTRVFGATLGLSGGLVKQLLLRVIAFAGFVNPKSNTDRDNPTE